VLLLVAAAALLFFSSVSFLFLLSSVFVFVSLLPLLSSLFVFTSKIWWWCWWRWWWSGSEKKKRLLLLFFPSMQKHMFLPFLHGCCSETRRGKNMVRSWGTCLSSHLISLCYHCFSSLFFVLFSIFLCFSSSN